MPDQSSPHDDSLVHIAVDVCTLCLSDAGGECHMPGCAYWMDDAPTPEVTTALRKLASRTVTDA